LALAGPKHPGNRQLCDKRGCPDAGARISRHYTASKVATFCAALWLTFTLPLTEMGPGLNVNCAFAGCLPCKKRKAEVIRFLTDPNAPFTNNEAERDLRMGKVRQKVSGCFRVVRGAEIFCSLRTVTCTARKQGWSVIQTLMKPSDQLIAEMRLG